METFLTSQQQDQGWSTLPKEYKEAVQGEYDFLIKEIDKYLAEGPLSNQQCEDYYRLLERKHFLHKLFGRQNLTSDKGKEEIGEPLLKIGDTIWIKGVIGIIIDISTSPTLRFKIKGDGWVKWIDA